MDGDHAATFEVCSKYSMWYKDCSVNMIHKYRKTALFTPGMRGIEEDVQGQHHTDISTKSIFEV